MKADEAGEQRRLAGAIASHHGDDLTPVGREGHTAQCGDAAMSHDDVADTQCRFARQDVHGGASSSRGLVDEGGETLAQWAGGPSGVAHCQGQRRPACEPSELDDRRCDRCVDHDFLRCADDDRCTVTGHHDDAIGVLHDTLKAVFREEHSHAEVVYEALERGQYFFCRTGIQR